MATRGQHLTLGWPLKKNELSKPSLIVNNPLSYDAVSLDINRVMHLKKQLWHWSLQELGVGNGMRYHFFCVTALSRYQMIKKHVIMCSVSIKCSIFKVLLFLIQSNVLKMVTRGNFRVIIEQNWFEQTIF